MSDRHDARDLKASIRELAAALEDRLPEHLGIEELQDFAAGALPEPERERIREHLALCRTCARKALDLMDSPALEPVPWELTDRELETQWTRFRAAAVPASLRWKRTALALAAVLLLGIVGLVVWGVRELHVPPTYVYLAYVESVETRGSSDQEPIRPPSWAGRVGLVLNLEASAYPEYGVQIVTADGRQIWSERGLPPQNDSVLVEVPARLLLKGIYKIHLSGPQGQPVDEYTVRVEPLPGK